MNISVVIPAWNCANWISATLDSVLSQENASFEVIVVDDGSTDNTPEILQQYQDKIKVIRIENSGGPSQPRNVGI
ncbi:MAG: glycosyltransferase, partial [bacterium]|nr:glycosyltransferase [bacterium]MCP4800666.1 glycosyltransferase [bacterium]